MESGGSLDIKLAVIEERLRGIVQATELQAMEYARRLDLLNHAHEQARQTLATYLPREIFDSALKEWSMWRAKIDIDVASNKQGVTHADLREPRISALEAWVQQRTGTGYGINQVWVYVVGFGALIAGVGGLIISFWK